MGRINVTLRYIALYVNNNPVRMRYIPIFKVKTRIKPNMEISEGWPILIWGMVPVIVSMATGMAWKPMVIYCMW